jgi:hypothetical protein
MKSLLVRRSTVHWPILRPRLQVAVLVIATIFCPAISVVAQVGIGIGNSTGYATAPSSSASCSKTATAKPDDTRSIPNYCCAFSLIGYLLAYSGTLKS